jgi:amino acid adenylation domain-containing protein
MNAAVGGGPLPVEDHLAAGFVRSAAAAPDATAVEVEGVRWSYERLLGVSAVIADRLEATTVPAEAPARTAIFAHRSWIAYAGLLAALMRGHAYVPLNRQFPVTRTREMFERSGSRAVIVDNASLVQLDAVLAGVAEKTVIIAPGAKDVGGLRRRFPGHDVFGKDDLARAANVSLRPPRQDDPAYLLFTSGSTGRPKGVLVAHRNVTPFIRLMADRYGAQSSDRFSQAFDLTFDLSVFDMFVAWEHGASVHCLPDKVVMKPDRFIRELELTIWFSVPSVAVFLQRLGALQRGAFTSLRWSLFCGEALPADIAEAWQSAAPNSTLENLYGPTEATIACTAYRWRPGLLDQARYHNLVPIGEPLGETSVMVVDSDLSEVGHDKEGELLVGGPQVTLGYLDDPARTAASFVVPTESDGTYYRTGDRAVRTTDGNLHYLGRLDEQVQIHGYRVELGEVEAAIRDVPGVVDTAAIAWPLSPAGAEGIVAFVLSSDAVDVGDVRSTLETRLPQYMRPREVRVLEDLPLNPNGKVDRKALYALMEEAE